MKANTQTVQDIESKDAPQPAAEAQKPALPQIRLVPVDGSDQPILANYTMLDVTSGMVFIQFGFVEPGVITAIQGAMQTDAKLPERINGRMAARIALGLDTLQALHHQLGTTLEAMTKVAQQRLAQYTETNANAKTDA